MQNVSNGAVGGTALISYHMPKLKLQESEKRGGGQLNGVDVPQIKYSPFQPPTFPSETMWPLARALVFQHSSSPRAMEEGYPRFLMCSALKCVLQSSLPAPSWVVFPVLRPSRSWLTSSNCKKKKKIRQGFRCTDQADSFTIFKTHFIVL